MKRLVWMLLAAIVPLAGIAVVRARSTRNIPRIYSSPSHRTTRAVPYVPRDKRGHIRRSATARAAFRKSHPCPATGKRKGPCPGYVIDHVVPLKRGGPDSASNMQWQTRAEARAKLRIE